MSNIVAPQTPQANIEQDVFMPKPIYRRSCLDPLKNCLFGSRDKSQSAAMKCLKQIGWSTFKTRQKTHNAFSTIATILPKLKKNLERARENIAQRANPQVAQVVREEVAPSETSQAPRKGLIGRVYSFFRSKKTLTREQQAHLQVKKDRANNRYIVKQAKEHLGATFALAMENVSMLDYSDLINSCLDNTCGLSARITYKTAEYVGKNKMKIAKIVTCYIAVINFNTMYPEANIIPATLAGIFRAVSYDLPVSMVSITATNAIIPGMKMAGSLSYKATTEAIIPGTKVLGSLAYNATTNAIIPGTKVLASLAYNATTKAILPGMKMAGEKALIPAAKAIGSMGYHFISCGIKTMTDSAKQMAGKAALTGVTYIAQTVTSFFPVAPIAANAICGLAANASL